MSDNDSNLKYDEFVVELGWFNNGNGWIIQATHRGVPYTAATWGVENQEEPSLLQEFAKAEILAQRIGRFLFPLDVGKKLDRALKEIAPRSNAGLRVVIMLQARRLKPQDAPFYLDTVPWEAAQYGAHDTFLVAMDKVSVVRRWEAPETRDDLFDSAHQKLAFVDASKSSNVEDDLDTDIPDLLPEEWAALGEFDDPEPSSRDLKKLAHDKISIFHFTGHGDAEGLILDDDKPFGGGELRGALKNTRLAVLSACESEGNSSQLYRSGLASELARAVPAVIGMSRKVRDTEAAVFSGELYRHLSAQCSLDESVRQGRLSLLRNAPHTLAFALPVFYLGVTGNTRPAVAVSTDPPQPRPATALLAHPLALVRGRTGDTVHGIESAGRAGLRVVRAEQAGDSPALLAFDARVVASQRGGEVIIGDLTADGSDVQVDQTRLLLPSQFCDARILAVSRSYKARTLRLVIADGSTTKLLTHGFEWLPPKTLDDGFAAIAAVDTTLGTVLLDGEDGQLISVPEGSVGPFSLRNVSGFDSAYSSGVGVAVAWGTNRHGMTALEVRRWDERPGAVRSGDPGWVEIHLDDFNATGVTRAGIVRELATRAIPRMIAVQRRDSIELIELPDTGSDTSPGQ